MLTFTLAAENTTKFCPVVGFISCCGPSFVASRVSGLPYGTRSHGSFGTDIIRLSVRFVSTVHGSLICVIQRLAGHADVCSCQHE